MVVIDQENRGYGKGLRVAQPLLVQVLPDEITNGLRAILIAFRGDELIELREKLFVE